MGHASAAQRRSGWALAAVLLVFSICTTAFAEDWQAGAGEDWKKVMEAARKEGKVVVGGRAALGQPLIDAFKRDTGLNIDFLSGEGRDITSRIEREARSGNVTIDFVLGGAGVGIGMMNEKQLTALKPQLMLPSVTDGKNWIDGKLKWVDNGETYLLIGGEYISGWPVFNSSVIKPGEITSWTDLLKPQYKGKIAAHDPRGGSTGAAAAAYLVYLHGEDFLKKLYIDQDVTLARTPAQLIEWVVRGNYPIVIGSLATDIEKYRRAGITTIAVGEMSDGPGNLLGGNGVILEAKNPPHPNAGTVFLNWYLSQPGQYAFSTAWETPSRRVDVVIPSLPAYTLPKPGVTYLDQYQEDWYVNSRPKVEKAIIKIMGQ